MKQTDDSLKEKLKEKAAHAALDYIETNSIIGIGSGSTVNHFIEALAKSPIKTKIEGMVAASIETEKFLKKHGIPPLNLNSTGKLAIYIDGADEINKQLQLIKGGGGALTREKIIAAASKYFICIADESKRVNLLGQKALPIEVIPMARSYVAREIVKLGGFPIYREKFVTDNGNIILDTKNWDFTDPIHLEKLLNDIPGIVCNGLFAKRPADKLLLGTDTGVTVIEK
ncbi:MAG: ribose-5-phosphate isomerase RpiA [Rickettsiella sp.]|nr:ribose-5-phosphate isomerase RpiA [Rickettsiella sp.]